VLTIGTSPFSSRFSSSLRTQCRRVLLGVGVMITLVVPATFPTVANAATMCGTTGSLNTSSNVCTYATPGTDSYTVPTGVSELTVNVYGSEGGTNGEGGNGGEGGEANATLAVTPGETVQITVGAQGSDNTGSNYYYAGSGGGASDVRTGTCATTLTCALASRVIVGGGGGGAGAFNYPDPTGAQGGAGGGVNGTSGTGLNGEGGNGASSSGGGAGGIGSGGSNGAAGTLGYGGGGAGVSVDQGGNGGDGYYGGGGGGGWSGLGGSGGGGSGYITSSALVGTFATGVQNGNGEIVIGELMGASTTTTLTSSSNPVSSGVAVTYSATVNPIPEAGTVSFSDGANTSIIPGCGAQSLNYATGVATCTVTYPSPAGSPHSVTAAYVGDTYYLASVSSALSQVVSVASSTTTVLSASPNPSEAGQVVTYRAAVSPIPDGGSVNFEDGGTSISGCAAQSVNTTTGVATCNVTYTTTTGSPHLISAIYGGDASFPTSTSAIVSEAVNRGSSATTVTSSANPSGTGQQVIYTATVNPVPEAGTVDFEDGSTAISGCASVSVNPTTGVATCAIAYTTTTGSPHSITAAYSGSSNFAASTSSTLSQTVSSGPPTYRTPGTYLYTVPAGVSELTVNAFGGEGGINGEGDNGGEGGEANATITVTAGETLQITVGAQGSGNTGSGYYYSGGGGGASDVRTGTCAASLSCALASRVIVAGGGGGAGAFNYPDPTGQIGGAGGGISGGAGTGLSGEGGGGGSTSGGGGGGTGQGGLNGAAGILGYGGAGAGTSVNQGGNGGDGYYGGGGGGGWSDLGGSGGGGSGYIAASALAGTLTSGVQNGNGEVVIGFTNVTPTTPTISNLPPSASYGSSFTPSVTTSGDGATSVSSNSLSICTVNGGVVSFVGLGTCSLTAAVGTGPMYASATGVAQTFTVGIGTPTTPTISNLPSSGAYGGSFTPIITTNGDGATSVSSNSLSICTVNSGVVSYVTLGTCSLTASVGAGSNYAGATGVAQTFIVLRATPVTPTISNLPSSGVYSGSFTPSVTTSGNGTTSVTSNSTTICIVASGVVYYVGVGTCSLTAVVAQGTDYLGATGSLQTFAVTRATPLVPTINNVPASGVYGGSFIPGVTTSGNGTTSVTSNSTNTCTVSSGVVSYVGVGLCSLTAAVSQGTDYASATGIGATFQIYRATPTAPTISNLPSSGVYGGSLTATVTTNGDGVTVVTSNSLSTCTVSGDVVSYVGVGTCSLTATIAQGSNYTASSGVAQTFAVVIATPTTPTISNVPSSGVYGGSFTPSVTTNADGTTSVTSNSTNTCMVSSGVVSFVGVGTCSLTSSVAAGTDYVGATGVAETFNIVSATPTVPTVNNIPSSGIYGGSFTPSVVTDGDGTTSVTSNSTNTCMVSSGVVSYVGVGTCSLTASISQGNDYASASGSSQTFVIASAAPTTPTINNLPSSGIYGGSFTPSVVTDGDGTTSVTSNSWTICTVSSGVVSFVGVGTCSLTASVSQGVNYTDASGVSQTFAVLVASPTTPAISNLPSGGIYGGSFTPSVTTTGDGTISVTSNSLNVCTVSSGVVSYVGVGTCSLTASVAQGTHYAGVTRTPQTFAIVRETPSTPTIDNLPSGSNFGGSFTPNVTTDGDGFTSVTSNSLTICTVSSGVVSFVGVGTCSLTAVVAQGSNYANASGVSQTFVVLIATPSAPTISNVPSNVIFGGSFTPNVTTDGDGVTSVTSNSLTICTVSSGVVSYVGVGTCSLTSSVAAGTDYAGATGVAQIFVVHGIPLKTPTAPTISNLPSSAIVGESFTPNVTTDGDGVTSVTSNSLTICTVSSGVVSYVGVGNCSLTSSVAAGTDYAGATGVAQSFSVTSANPTINNLPSSGVVGGSFTPSVTPRGDGTASVISDSTTVCTVSHGVVSYVGVGTCSLTALITGDAAGVVQSFSIKAVSSTAAPVVIKNNGSVVVTTRDLKVPVNTKVTIKIIRSGKTVTTVTTRVTATHIIKYTTGKLKQGSYKIDFVVGGKLLKTTLVNVK
jgi:hypothetical protein